jgi:general secretion pathway protein E
MRNKLNDPFSAANVLPILVKRGLLAEARASDILGQESVLKDKLENMRQRRSGSSSSSIKADRPVTIIDIIHSLHLKRVDAPLLELDEDAIFQALAQEWDFPYKKIDPLKLDLNVVTATLPRSFALKHQVLPVDISDGVLTVATSNPFNREVMEDIKRASGLNIHVVLTPKSDIIKLINEFFGFRYSVAAAQSQLNSPTVDLGNVEQYVRMNSASELLSNDQHVVNALDHLLGYAFDQKASDIHIEPKRDTSLIRMRIDGMLHTVHKLPKNVHSAIVSRIKNLAGMDMAEKRRPQDGRIKTEKGGTEVEIRVSTVPVAFGEKVVMRIMNPDILFQDLDKLGFTEADLTRYYQIIQKPHGIVLVTGPTGSGKSTTLYSTLHSLYTPEVNITTIEEPIEMVHEAFNQIAVQPQVGIRFDSIIRYILRQDPDIIMVGEIRDLETAQNAIQAALTGHLVLSTLHTNDAPSSIIRLLDMGIPSFLIQASLCGVMAQRLVRTICSHCRESFTMDAAELEDMGLAVERTGPLTLFRGSGCTKCRNTGYRGRTAVLEVLSYTDAIRYRMPIWKSFAPPPAGKG